MNKSLFFVYLFTICLQHVTNAQNIDAVVITAKRDTSYRKTTCNFEVRITRPLISDYAEYNFTKMINGLVTGVQSTNGGGQPGSSAEMLIRGMSSISDNNAPLIILDGIPYYGDLSAINSNDIDNITISKDPVATFDFGNRGGNGIVYINTKKEFKYSSKKLEIDAKFGVNTQAISDYKTLGIKDFYETMNTAIKNAGLSDNVVDYLGGYNAYYLNGVGDSLQDEYLIDPATGKLNSSAQLKYQDSWRKEMRRIGIRQNYNIASSAHNNKAGYYLSVGYLNDKGYIQQTDYKRYTVRFNGDYKPIKWVTLGLRAQGTIGEQYSPPESIFKSTQLMAPVFPVYYRNAYDVKEKDPLTGTDKYDWGSLNYYTPNSSIGDRRYYPGLNDIALLYLDEHSNKTYMYIVNSNMKVTFLKGFTYTANLAYNFNKNEWIDAYNGNYGMLASVNGAEDKTTVSLNTRSFIHKLSWEKEINKHSLTLVAGNEYFKQKDGYLNTFRTLNSPSSSGASSSYNGSVFNKGYFSKVQYEYDGKYMLFAGFRKDATLMTESRWTNNWAVGAAYTMSEERFMRNINWINQLKLKVNYGTQGRYFPLYSKANMPLLQPPTSGLPPGNVVPTSGNQLNIGMEGGLFNNRLYFAINAYSRNSGENVLQLNLWPTSPSTQFNYNNRGIELSFYTTNIDYKNFSWNSVFTFTHNRNTITRLPEGFDSIITVNNLVYKKGNSIADFYLVEYAGVDPANGNALYYARDANGNEVKTNMFWDAVATNRKNFGSAFPDFYGSLTNHFTYKNLELSIQVNYSLGGKYYDQVYQDLMSNGYNANSWSTDILNYWTPNNRNTNVPKVNRDDLNINATTSRFLKSSSYLSISNLYFGYTFDETKIKKTKMKSLRVYLTANNLWMFATRKGINPQGSFYGTPGYVYLPARSVMLGLNVGI